MEQRNKWNAILLFGMPGSGKGTQGKSLGCIPGYFHVASGDVFRELNQLGQLGRQVAEFTSAGRLVPDDLTIRIWRRHMQLVSQKNLFDPERDVIVSDGLPRTNGQAELLDETLNVIRIFYLKLRSDEEAVDRIKRRALLEKRIDDAEETVIRSRLQTFRRETEITLSHYDPSCIVEVDASQRPMRVLSDLTHAICQTAIETERVKIRA